MPSLTRRSFLRAGAVTLSLPFFDAMLPRGARADAKAEAQAPRRMVLIHRPLGTYHPYLVPETAGPEYKATRYLEKLETHRKRLTVFSGVSHLGYPNSHHTESALFTGVSPDGIARSDDIHNT